MVLAGAVLAAGGQAALAQKKVIVAAGESAGGVVNAAISRIAKAVTQKSSISVRLRTYSGAEAWLPLLDNGKAQIGVHFAATAWLAYNQIDSKLKLRNLRLIRSSRASTPLGFMVRKNSGINTVKDLKGKRVAGGYGAHPIMRRLAGGIMAAYGLKWSDVKMVPVPAAGQGSRALQDDRVDAAWYAVFAPATREVHSKIGIKFLPIPLSPTQMKTAREKIFPGILQLKVPANPPWAPKGTPLVSYEIYVLASTKTDDATVKTVLGALWDNAGMVQKIHPVLRGFKNKVAVSKRPVIPYHKAAIEFYKSKGTWTAQSDAANAKVAK
ncbi:MAG: TAXI family TRAP transporter solute-binding subunit [Rhodospirillales bacterium]|nr:TAXI family TRAP transporter solute-binding subunit [Rhodospirillales bacterium]